jgi:formate/nitrite transporter FocA (FNT family)
MAHDRDPHPPREAATVSDPLRQGDRGDQVADLEPAEERKAEEEESLSAGVAHEAIRREGEKELARSVSALAWSGLAGGSSMGLSLLAEGALRSHLPDAEWRPLVAKLGYPVGFLAVILGSQQLFTENTLTPVIPLLARRTGWMLRRVARLWAVVLVANLVGTLLFALAAARTSVFPAELRDAFAAIASEAMEGPTLTRFVRAVPAGWIIALLVWMLPGASNGKVAVIFLMTWLIGAAGLAHVVVGAVEVQFLVFIGELSYVTFLVDFLLPVLVGNVLGGLLLVALVNHAQVTSGE